MFNTSISRTSSFPQSLKDKICVCRNGLDDTLFMTATILLYNRVDNLNITYTLDTTFNTDVISLNPDEYSFHWFEGINSNPDDLLKSIKKDVKSIDKIPTHEKFLSEQLKQQIYIRILPEENTVCLFTSHVSWAVWHGAQFFIPKFFKIFKEKPLTKEEISFLETLTFKVNGNYVTKLIELTNTDSFRNYLLKDQLQAFEKRLFEQKVMAAQNNLNSIEEKMDRAMEMYREACEKRIEAIALVSGLKTMADEVDEHTELQDYLLNNPRLCNVTLSDSEISFIVKTFLSPHHVDEWEVLTQKNQMFDSYVTSRFTREDVKLLLDAIFSESRCLKLRMCAYFTMDYFGSSVNTQRNYAFKTTNKELSNYIPNPHLHHNACFGQNKNAILNQLKCGDAIGAIECAISCAQRINIHENASFRPFVNDLFDSKGKCLIAEDGTEMTVEEAIAYLKRTK